MTEKQLSNALMFNVGKLQRDSVLHNERSKILKRVLECQLL